jgi:hypothetical protein
MARSSVSIRSLVKTGFGLSIGVFLGQMIFLAIGMVFFIPGFILFTRASSDKEEGKGSHVGGLVLMGIGVIIMGGLGFGVFLDSVGDMF